LELSIFCVFLENDKTGLGEFFFRVSLFIQPALKNTAPGL